MKVRLFVVLSLLFLFSSLPVISQIDNAGSGRALLFDGVDDYVDFGDIFDDLNLPVSVSAWIWVDPSKPSHSPIFVSQDNLSLYNGFWFVINPTHLFVGYGDGLGSNNPQFRREKSAPHNNVYGRWTHVCAVVKGAIDMDIYINGVKTDGILSGSSGFPMNSNFPDEVAKAGHWYTNDVAHHFKGMIDEIRVWNIALTETQLREQMCKKLSGNEPGLIGYWNFDETSGNETLDKSATGAKGTLRNGTTRVFSGAPLGDQSTFTYDNGVSSFEFEDVSVTQISGNPYGMHIYRVDAKPSQTGNIPDDKTPETYYGVFTAKRILTPTFQIANCAGFHRTDNSEATWGEGIPLNFADRAEVFFDGQGDIKLDLGPDMRLCGVDAVEIDARISDSASEIVWSTGETTSNITVHESGTYSVTVTNLCGSWYDEVQVHLMPRLEENSVPNVISPNGDEYNQFFVLGEADFETVNLQIFNRWGRQVYESANYANNWDGQDVSGGVYFYVLMRECGEVLKGLIHVLK